MQFKITVKDQNNASLSTESKSNLFDINCSSKTHSW